MSAARIALAIMALLAVQIAHAAGMLLVGRAVSGTPQIHLPPGRA